MKKGNDRYLHCRVWRRCFSMFIAFLFLRTRTAGNCVSFLLGCWDRKSGIKYPARKAFFPAWFCMSRFTSLGLFTFARVGCLLQLWIKTSDLGDAQIMIKKPPDIFLIVHSFSYPFGNRKNICTYYLLNNWYTTNTNLPPFVVFRGIKFQS